MDTDTSTKRLPRRRVLQWFAAAAALDASGLPSFGQDPKPAVGYGTDPKVAGFYNPGDFWDLTFTDKERSTATSLADIIIPADDFGPAASDVRVPDFVDEWISAPYPRQQKDRNTIIPALQWIEQESQQRYQKSFANGTQKEQTAICEKIEPL